MMRDETRETTRLGDAAQHSHTVGPLKFGSRGVISFPCLYQVSLLFVKSRAVVHFVLNPGRIYIVCDIPG